MAAVAGQGFWFCMLMSNSGCRGKRQDTYGAPSGPILSVAPPTGFSSGIDTQYQDSGGTNSFEFGDSFAFSQNSGSIALPISEAFENFDSFGPNSGFLNEFTDSSLNTENKQGKIPSTFDSIGDSSSRNLDNGRQFNTESPSKAKQSSGGIDFSKATRTDDGRLCVIKDETVDKVSKNPILECRHKNTEQCHYTYATNFKPSQEEVCEENFEKLCQITYNKKAIREKVKKCYRPTEKVCNGQGEDQCSTVYESSCTTRYVEKQPRKYVADTGCKKLPIEICGAGCVFEEGEEECHEKEVDTLVEVPEESCDLNPQKTCRFTTKLVPKLKPTHECTIVPKETCILKFTHPRQVPKPLQTRWCLDPTPAAPGESYDESNASAAPLSLLD